MYGSVRGASSNRRPYRDNWTRLFLDGRHLSDNAVLRPVGPRACVQRACRLPRPRESQHRRRFMAYLRHGSWRQAEKRKEEAEKEGRQPVRIKRCALWDSAGQTYRIAVSNGFDASLGNRTIPIQPSSTSVSSWPILRFCSLYFL